MPVEATGPPGPAAEALTEKLVSFKLAALISTLIGLSSGAFGAGTAIAGYRSATSMEISAANRATIAEITEMRDRNLRHYVSREEWQEWRRSEGEKRDRQYFDLRELILRHRK